MKITMVTPFPDERTRIVGGVAGVAKYLADELRKRPDIELTVVVPQGSKGSATSLEDWDGVAVHRLAREGFWRFLPGTFYDLIAGRRQVHELLRRLAPDVAHFQGTTFLAAGCEAGNVLTIHGIAEKDAAWEARWGGLRRLKCLVLKLTEDYGRRRAPHVILISDYVGTVLPESAARRSWRIDNPIADSFFEIDRAAVAGRVFCCGTIMPRKNILGMIAAFRETARRVPGARLRIAGNAEPGYLRACRGEVQRAGLEASVDFLGNLSVLEVQAELSKASCFAMPSFQETAPLSIAEAMAVGVPVVASTVGGIPDMVEHGSTGFLVDPRDPAAISEGVARILADARLARSMGLRARTLARERCRASVVARKTVDVYREILGSRRA